MHATVFAIWTTDWKSLQYRDFFSKFLPRRDTGRFRYCRLRQLIRATVRQLSRTAEGEHWRDKDAAETERQRSVVGRKLANSGRDCEMVY